MYVAVKGGEQAIDAAHRLLAEERRGDRGVPALTLAQIAEQLSLAVDRVMNEGSLHDHELAALAIRQARGDLIEAIFLIRAARTTLARFGYGWGRNDGDRRNEDESCREDGGCEEEREVRNRSRKQDQAQGCQARARGL